MCGCGVGCGLCVAGCGLCGVGCGLCVVGCELFAVGCGVLGVLVFALLRQISKETRDEMEKEDRVHQMQMNEAPSSVSSSQRSNVFVDSMNDSTKGGQREVML